MPYSTELAHMYDALMGDNTVLATTLKRLLFQYTPKKKKLLLLELGCGTGNILKSLPKRFQLYGIDNSEGMLEVARKKVPQAQFTLSDMSNFSLPQKFDVIISVFDSINHLTGFVQWTRMFAVAAKHLTTNGIFIFDMNTQRRHALLSTYPAYILKKKKQLQVTKILHLGDNLYGARFQIFSDMNKKKVALFEEQVLEASFPIEKVKKALQTHFKVIALADPYREKVGEETGRIFFVCKKNKTTTAS